MSPRPFLNRAWEIEKQTRSHCKTASLTVMETNDNIESCESVEQMPIDILDRDASTTDLVEISFHAFLGNTTSKTIKLQGNLNYGI